MKVLYGIGNCMVRSGLQKRRRGSAFRHRKTMALFLLSSEYRRCNELINRISSLEAELFDYSA